MLSEHDYTVHTTLANPPEYILSSDVIFVPVDDGSAQLLDLDGAFYALTATGAEMLRARSPTAWRPPSGGSRRNMISAWRRSGPTWRDCWVS